LTFIDKLQHLQIQRKPDGGAGGGLPPRSSRSQGMSRYWRNVKSYQKPGMSIREVRGGADFSRLHGRYKELREELPARKAGERGEPWREWARDSRETLEEMGVEDDAESRDIDWGS
jgi:hypothetical protein